MTSSRALPVTLAVWATSFWIVLFDNQTFWQTFWSAQGGGKVQGLVATAALGGVLVSFLGAVLRLLCWGRSSKPVLAFLLILSALAAHFIDSYGILVDKGLVRNIVETDTHEAADLLSLTMLVDVTLRGLLPAALLSWLPLNYGRAADVIRNAGWHAVAFACTFVLAFAVFYPEYAATFRNHRELRFQLTPSNVFNGVYGYFRHSRTVPARIAQTAPDARRVSPEAPGRKPLLVLLVIGETARAANFSLGGYWRQTNHPLAGRDVVYFPDVTACGTDTATSVPCMFSNLGADKFSASAAAARENVLDVLKRAGVSVLWRDNNSGCKGVCARLPTEDLSKLRVPGLCSELECNDEILLHGLPETLRRFNDDAIVVLHQKGSHGPAYFRRYPPSSAKFQPTCDTNQIQHCSNEALVNTYDNTIYYTSEVLAQLIDLLSSQADERDSVLLYLSDHGESLGESNIYLHGLPKLLAPRNQTAVPMIAWASPGAQSRLRLSSECLRLASETRYSHDNLFHTLLGVLGVESSSYRSELDVFALARKRSSACAGT